MSEELTTWQRKDIYKVREQRNPVEVANPEPEKLRKEIEPWLTALFQSEHLSLLTGAGLSSATHVLATGKPGAGMANIPFTIFKEQIEAVAKDSAEKAGRGEPNIEDQIRVANELIRGLEIFLKDQDKEQDNLKTNLKTFKTELANGLKTFTNGILLSEKDIVYAQSEFAAEYLMNFLVSFASRSATRERLNIFTTNYDRVIEFGAELAGIRLLDRFVGMINPIFRSSRMSIDMHYNPPGIRGEPRYLEGVVQFSKLHGSLDWAMRGDVVRRIALPYGAESIEKFADNDDILMVYPNSSKDRETAEYPYVELFRDFAASVCCPNSTLVLYGYSFGDQHINRVIEDMLSIPSTHLVIICYKDDGNRACRFYHKVRRPAQMTLLVGTHFADLKTLVEHYLPKPAIDRNTVKMAELLKSRGLSSNNDGKPENGLEEFMNGGNK